MKKNEKKNIKKNVNKKKIEPKERMRLPFINPKYRNETYYAIRFEGKYKREEIRKYAQEKSDLISRTSPNSSSFRVSLKLGKNIFRSGSETRPGEQVSLWSSEDSGVELDDEEIIGFDIIITLPN